MFQMSTPPEDSELSTVVLSPEPVAPPRRRRTGVWVMLALALGGVIGAAVGAAAIELTRDSDRVSLEIVASDVSHTSGSIVVDAPGGRSLGSYGGYGTWIDVFDYSPAYTAQSPVLVPDDVAEMADFGVDTLYMQAARLDTRSPNGLEDPWLLADFLLSAHAVDIDVVAWYLPKWSEDDSDLRRVEMLHEFEILGHRFDGVAIDIEWTGGDIDLETRNSRLVSLSAAANKSLAGDPLAAVVLPPVLTEVVNTAYWPEFPWTEIADDYDVWMPMSYWSFRSQRSGYGDGYTYNEESTRRLRDNLGDPDAVVHGIGGIGGVDGVNDDPNPEEPLTELAELDAFVNSLVDTDSIGGSVYDWVTLESEARERLARLFGEGPGSQLPAVP